MNRLVPPSKRDNFFLGTKLFDGGSRVVLGAISVSEHLFCKPRSMA
ncbi:MAG: hypothetical protein KHY44_11705 [Clostridiales bacterium]|nr:hypothetical protein [Clostridiales bacterium]